MKKIFTQTFLVFSFAFIFSFAFLINNALASATLTEGEFVVLGDDPSAEDFINQLMFHDAVLEIDAQNKVKGSANTDISDVSRKGALFSGTASLNMSGDYDEKTNTLSGTFAVKHVIAMKDEQEAPLLSYYNNDTMTFDGTFTGEWNNAGDLEIAFTGTKHSVGKTEVSNGKEDEYDRTNKWNNKAIFTEDWCASLVARDDTKKAWSLIPAAMAKDSGARFTDFSGEVLVSPGGNMAEETPAERDMVLEEGTIVTTGGDSCAIISFADMSTFIMKPRSKVILDKAPEKQSKLRLVAGNIWVNLKHIYETGHLDVTMNQAIAGTKGTTFVAEENGSLSSLKVIDGLMSFKAVASNEEVDVAPGEMATADTSGVIKKSAFDADAEAGAWKKMTNRIEGAVSVETADETGAVSAVPAAAKNKFAPFVGVIAVVVMVIVVVLFSKKEKAQ